MVGHEGCQGWETFFVDVLLGEAEETNEKLGCLTQEKEHSAWMKK
jgi:hypothetical protein